MKSIELSAAPRRFTSREMDFRIYPGRVYHIWYSSSLWLEIRASVRPYVYPPLANFYFCLVLKPFSVHEGTMGAIAELQVDAFSTNTGNVFQSHRYVRATGTIQVFVTCYIPE